MYRNDKLRSNLGYLGESDIRGGNNLSLGSNVAGLRSESRVYQPSYSQGTYNTNGQSLMSIGQSYGDILERVRHTMHTTGSISNALEGTMAGTSGLSSVRFTEATSAELNHSGAVGSGLFNQTMVNPLGSGNNTSSSYPGNTSWVVGIAGGNATNEVVRNTSNGEEINHQPPYYTP